MERTAPLYAPSSVAPQRLCSVMSVANHRRYKFMATGRIIRIYDDTLQLVYTFDMNAEERRERRKKAKAKSDHDHSDEDDDDDDQVDEEEEAKRIDEEQRKKIESGEIKVKHRDEWRDEDAFAEMDAVEKQRGMAELKAAGVKLTSSSTATNTTTADTTHEDATRRLPDGDITSISIDAQTRLLAVSYATTVTIYSLHHHPIDLSSFAQTSADAPMINPFASTGGGVTTTTPGSAAAAAPHASSSSHSAPRASPSHIDWSLERECSIDMPAPIRALAWKFNKRKPVGDLIIGGSFYISCYAFILTDDPYSSYEKWFDQWPTLNGPLSPSNAAAMNASSSLSFGAERIAVSADGSCVAISGVSPCSSVHVYIYDETKQRSIHWCLTHPAAVLMFQFHPKSPCDDVLLTLCADGYIRVWRQAAAAYDPQPMEIYDVSHGGGARVSTKGALTSTRSRIVATIPATGTPGRFAATTATTAASSPLAITTAAAAMANGVPIPLSSPTNRSGVMPFNPSAPTTTSITVTTPSHGVATAVASAAALPSSSSLQSPPGGAPMEGTPNPAAVASSHEGKAVPPSSLSTFLPPPPRSTQLPSSTSAPGGLTRTPVTPPSSSSSSSTASVPIPGSPSARGGVPTITSSPSTPQQPASQQLGVVSTRTISGGASSGPVPPSPGAKRTATPPLPESAANSLSSNPAIAGSSVPVPMTPSGTGLGNAPMGFPPMTSSPSGGSSSSAAATTGLASPVGSSSMMPQFDYSPPDVNLNHWYVACDLEPSKPEGNTHVAVAWLPETGHTDPTANSLINVNYMRFLSVDRFGTVIIWIINGLTSTPAVNPSLVALCVMDRALVIRSGLEPQALAMCSARRLPSSMETDSQYWLTMLSTHDCVRTWTITVKRSTGTGDFAGSCRLLAAIGGHSTIPSRITAISHVDAPYMATITSEGRVVVWILSQAYVVVDSSGRPPLHYETHFDSIVANRDGHIEPYTHVAWSPFARSGKGLRLFCGGRGFVDIFGLPSIGGVRTRDAKGLPFTWKKVGRLSFSSDAQLVGVHAVPFPTKLDRVMVTVVTSTQLLAWCVPHRSWTNEAKVPSIIASDPFHTLDISSGEGVSCSASHALAPLRATTIKDVDPISAATTLPKSSSASTGGGASKNAEAKDTPFVFAASSSSSSQSKTKRLPRTVSGAFIIIGLTSGAIRIIELSNTQKQTYTLHEFAAYDHTPVLAIKALSLSRLVTQSIMNDDLSVWEAESDITTYRREATLPVIATATSSSSDSKRELFGAVAPTSLVRAEGKETKAAAREGAPSAPRLYDLFDMGDGTLRVISTDKTGQLSMHCYEDSTKAAAQQWTTTSYNPPDAENKLQYFVHFAVAQPVAQAFLLLTTDAVLYPIVPPKATEVEQPKQALSFAPAAAPTPAPPVAPVVLPEMSAKEQRNKAVTALPRALASELDDDSKNSCIICMSTMEAEPDEEHEIPRKLPCGHILHHQCLRNHLDTTYECPWKPGCTFVIPVTSLAGPPPAAAVAPAAVSIPASSPLSTSNSSTSLSASRFGGGGTPLAASSGSRGLGGAPNVVGSALATLNAAAAQAALDAKQVVVPLSYATTWRHIPWCMLFTDVRFAPHPVVQYHPTVLAQNLINGNYQRVKNVLYYLYQNYCENPKLKEQKNPIVSLPWDYVLNEGKVATAAAALPPLNADGTTGAPAKQAGAATPASGPAKKAADTDSDSEDDDPFGFNKKKQPVAAVDPMSGDFDLGAFGGGFGSNIKKKKNDSDDDDSDDDGKSSKKSGGGDDMDAFDFGGGFGNSSSSAKKAAAPAKAAPAKVAVVVVVKAPAPPKSIPLKTCEFTQREADKLQRVLQSRTLPYLTAKDNLRLLAVMNTVTQLEDHSRSLDECGSRFMVAVKMHNFLKSARQIPESTPLSIEDVVWALHSNSQDTLLQMTLGLRPANLMATGPPATSVTWESLKSLGIGYWLTNPIQLRDCFVHLARCQYAVAKNPNDCLLTYLALGQKDVLLGLFGLQPKLEGVFKFLSNDFTNPRWQKAAKVNAMEAMKIKKYEVACGFFILGGGLQDALSICFRQLKDFQLGLCLARLAEDGTGVPSPLFKEALRDDVQKIASDTGQVWLEHIALWLQKRKDEALQVLVKPGTNQFTPSTSSFLKTLSQSNAPDLADVDVTRASLTIAARRSAYEYARIGCLELALDEWPGTEELFDDDAKESKKEAKAAATVAMASSAVEVKSKPAAPKRGGYMNFDQPEEDDSDPMASFDFGGPPKKPAAKAAAAPAVSSPAVPVALPKPKIDPLHNLPVVARRSFQNHILASLLARRSLFSNELPGNPGARKAAEQKASAAAADAKSKKPKSEDDDSGSDDDLPAVAPAAAAAAADASSVASSSLSSDPAAARREQEVTTLPQDLDVLLTKFPVDRERALRNVSRYCLTRKQYLPFIAISLHASRPHYVTRFLRREIGSLSRMFRSKDLSFLTLDDFGPLVHATKELLSWRQAIVTAYGLDPQFALMGDWAMLTALIHASMFLTALRKSDYYAVHRILQADFQDIPVIKERSEDDDEKDEDDDDAHKWMSDRPASIKIESKFYDFTRLMTTWMAIRRFHHQFATAFLQSGLNSPKNGRALEGLDTALRTCLDRMTSYILHIFQHNMERLVTAKMPKEEKATSTKKSNKSRGAVENKTDNLSDVSLTDVLTPLQRCQLKQASELWEALNLSTMMRNTANDIMQYLGLIATDNPYFHRPLDIFKLLEKTDLPQALAAHSQDPRFVVVASSVGLREINIESSLKYRNRNKDFTMTNDESQTWHGVLHRFDQSEHDHAPAGISAMMFTRPVYQLQQALCLNPVEMPVTESHAVYSRHMQKAYEDFTNSSANRLASTRGTAVADKDIQVTSLASHPHLPLYVSAGKDGRVLLWHFGRPNYIGEFSLNTTPVVEAKGHTPAVITRIRFNEAGTKLAATTHSGRISIWSFQYRPASVDNPVVCASDNFDVHDKHANDFEFVKGGSLVATAGESHDHQNVVVWDLLYAPHDRISAAFKCHDGGGGATALCYVAATNTLVTGGNKGQINIYDLNKMSLLHKIDDTKGGRIFTMCYDRWSNMIYSGGNGGHVKAYDATNFERRHEFVELYANKRQSGFNVFQTVGVTDVIVSGKHMYCCGAGGAVKYIRKKAQPFNVL